MGNASPFVILICSAVLCGCGNVRRTPSHAAPDTGVLHVHCTWTPAHCGGAYIDFDAQRPEQGWAGTLFLRSAKPVGDGLPAINDLSLPVIDSVRMNARGDGYVRLRPGMYLLLERDRIDDRQAKAYLREHAQPTEYHLAADTSCMRQWLTGPFDVIAVAPGDTAHVRRNFSGRCSWDAVPCVQYIGPLPP